MGAATVGQRQKMAQITGVNLHSRFGSDPRLGRIFNGTSKKVSKKGAQNISAADEGSKLLSIKLVAPMNTVTSKEIFSHQCWEQKC